MWRFLPPAFLAIMGASILLLAGARADAQSTAGVPERANDSVGDAASSHASPQSPTPPHPAQGPSVSDDRATDLRHQVSDLQDLVAQVNQQLAQRKAQGPTEAAGGQQGAPDASQPDDMQRQDSELHNELQGLVAQLGQELQLEVQTPPVADVAQQQERQAARDALKHEIADLQREDNELQGLMAHRGAAVAQPAPEVRRQLARMLPQTPVRFRATRPSIRPLICKARLPICSDRMMPCNASSLRTGKSSPSAPMSSIWCKPRRTTRAKALIRSVGSVRRRRRRWRWTGCARASTHTNSNGRPTMRRQRGRNPKCRSRQQPRQRPGLPLPGPPPSQPSPSRPGSQFSRPRPPSRRNRCPRRLPGSNCRPRSSGCPRVDRMRHDACWRWCRPRWCFSPEHPISPIRGPPTPR